MRAKKIRFDVSKLVLPDAALMELHDRLAASNAAKPGSFGTLTGDDRRSYWRDRQRERRARLRKAASSAAPLPSAANVRQALADAALMILAADAPGADAIRKVLADVFQARPGAPLSIETRARRGRLRPKLICRDPS